MNRRDFLKTLCLALSALVLPKARVEPQVAASEPRKPSGKDAIVEMFDGTAWVELPGASLKTHRLTDYTEAGDELIGDAEPGWRELLYEDGTPQTLMGYPIYVCDDMLAMARDAAKVADEQGLVAPWDV